MKYTIKQLAKITTGEVLGNDNVIVNDFIIDSRKVSKTDGIIFVAIKGERNDGHNYINELYKQGIKIFLVNKTYNNTKAYADATFLIVNNTLKAFQKIVAAHRANFNIPVIGITGSNGKTILKEWLFDILKKTHKITRSPKSYNSQVGVPLSVWQINENTELGIFEAGISKPGEMQHLAEIIKPTIGIFSNIGDAHQENFIDYKHKISEKLKLFKNSDVLIYCKDYQLLDVQIKTELDFDYDNKLFSWSKKYPADLYINEVKTNDNGTQIKAKYKNENIDIEIPFTDKASIENAINLWCTLLYMQIPDDIIKNGMKKLHTIAMRLELKKGINNCTIINDAYNSDIESLNIALDFLLQQTKNTKKTLILSDIIESGKIDSALYTEIASIIQKKQISRFIGIGEKISKNKNVFNKNAIFFKNTDEFIENFNISNFSNEDILLKGARTFKFERISSILQEKIHETILEINLNALTNNLNYYKSLLKPETKIMAMVKAFSYGTGMSEIASLLEYQGVDYLTVAYIDEGVALRKKGISLPIMVMNPNPSGFDLMIEYNLEPEIYNFSILDAYYKTIRKNGIVNGYLHLKIDTGMHRLGFEPNEIDSLITILKTRPTLKIKSIFTHLAGTDAPELDDFTHKQAKLFKDVASKLKTQLQTDAILHILNSNGIERFPEYQFDMVRLGIGMYGFGYNQEKLSNVSTLKTIITQIKTIAPQETVGYNRKGIMPNGGKIAVIPIGYADGLRRELSNGKGSVIINNNICKIIGNICMDMTMVDISNIEAKEGDTVIIFNDKLTVKQIAETLNTIPYEILTGISQRVKRVYFQE